MSPPAHLKEISSDSKSSANIIENLSPKADHLDQQMVNNSTTHLTKYNRSAYKLKQYISDVNRINAKQMKKNSNILKNKKHSGTNLSKQQTQKKAQQLNDS